MAAERILNSNHYLLGAGTRTAEANVERIAEVFFGRGAEIKTNGHLATVETTLSDKQHKMVPTVEEGRIPAPVT